MYYIAWGTLPDSPAVERKGLKFSVTLLCSNLHSPFKLPVCCSEYLLCELFAAWRMLSTGMSDVPSTRQNGLFTVATVCIDYWLW